MSDDAGLDKIEARLDMAEKRHDVLEDDLRQARVGFSNMVQGVHNRVCKLEASIKHHESGIDEYGNSMPETFADRLRHLERKVFQIESDRNPLRGFDVTCSAAPSQPPTSPPTCRLCNDTKIERVYNVVRGWENRLCPCLKVGDVVSAEAANMLPVGSRIEQRGVGWERGTELWFVVLGSGNPAAVVYGDDCTILRIGPGDEAKQGEDAKPDKAEEIARECYNLHYDSGGNLSIEEAVASVLRKHGVGKEPTLAEVLAREDMRPLVDAVKAALYLRGLTQRPLGDMDEAVDAIPPELRAAVDGVK